MTLPLPLFFKESGAEHLPQLIILTNQIMRPTSQNLRTILVMLKLNSGESNHEHKSIKQRTEHDQ